MNLDALIHRKFPPITQQYDAKDTIWRPGYRAMPITRAAGAGRKEREMHDKISVHSICFPGESRV
jgi:hypothetical protein